MRLFPTAEPGHRYDRVTSARVLSAVFNLAVGLRLLWPDDSLVSSPAYGTVRAVFFGDGGLGAGLLLMGLVAGSALYTDAFERLAAAVTLLGLATWIVFAFGLLRDNGSQIGTLAYGILAAGVHAYAFAHLLAYRDQRLRDQRRTADGGAA